MVKQSVNPFHHAVNVAFVAGAANSYPFGLVCQLGRHVQGQHQNGNLRGLSSDLFRGIQAVHFRHLEIQNDYIRVGLLGFLYRFPTVSRLTTDLPRIVLFQEGSQAATHELAVVYDENPNGRRLPRCVQNRHASKYESRVNMSIPRIA
jgi:hypothetical protein